MASMEDCALGWFLELEEEDDCYNFVNNSFEDFAAHHHNNSFITHEENNVVQPSESPSESYTSDYSIFMPNKNNNGNNSNITIPRTATISFAGGSQQEDQYNFQADQFEERPLKQLKVDYNKKSSTLHHHHHHHNHLVSAGVNKGGAERNPDISQDHILAERKRREKLNQKFIALSAILPGLKKSDKASVLEEAIRHVKELQEIVKHMEQVKNTKSEKTVVKRCNNKVVSPGGDDSSEQGHNNNSSDDCSDVDEDDKTGPEIEVRFSEKNVLIRVHCQLDRATSLSNFLREIESLHLSVMNTSVMPFGKTATDITLIAQMDDGFSMTTNDVVKHLQCVMRT